MKTKTRTELSDVDAALAYLQLARGRLMKASEPMLATRVGRMISDSALLLVQREDVVRA